MKISPPLPSTATNISNVEDDSLISRHYRTFLWNEITKEIKLGKGKVKKTETVCSSSKTKRICRSSKTKFAVHQNSSEILHDPLIYSQQISWHM